MVSELQLDERVVKSMWDMQITHHLILCLSILSVVLSPVVTVYSAEVLETD